MIEAITLSFALIMYVAYFLAFLQLPRLGLDDVLFSDNSHGTRLNVVSARN